MSRKRKRDAYDYTMWVFWAALGLGMIWFVGDMHSRNWGPEPRRVLFNQCMLRASNEPDLLEWQATRICTAQSWAEMAEREES